MPHFYGEERFHRAATAWQLGVSKFINGNRFFDPCRASASRRHREFIQILVVF
jgi:hypothetical protein